MFGRLTFKQFFFAVAACLILSLALGELYAATNFLTSSRGPWLAPVIINTLLAAIAWRIAKPIGPARYGAWAYAPAAAVLVVTILAALFSRWLIAGATEGTVFSEYLVFVLWVPIVEEFLFRVGIGGFFRERLGITWGSYFSAILFALVHAHPTLRSWLNLEVGLPVGPLLLGLCCEALYVKTGRILPAILLHAVCNLTVVIFAILDSRWLTWLSLFYH